MHRRVLAVALAAGLIAGMLTAVPAHAAVTLTVKAGGEFGKNEPAFTARMMAPDVDGVPTIQVHTDDVIHFLGTPVLLGRDQEPTAWWTQYGTGIDAYYGAIASDPDGDGQGVDAPTKFNLRIFSSTLDNCGDSEANACSFDPGNDPMTVMNPGDEVDGYFVKVAAQPNTTFYAVNLPAASHTFLRIDVLPGNQEGTTQDQLDDAAKTLLAKDKRTYNRLADKLSKPTFTRRGGHRVYDAYAGYDTATIRILRMFPERLDVHKGDSVKWHFHLVGEQHTASFPFKKADEVANSGFVPECDPDGQDGDGPDTPPDFQNPEAPCPEGSEPEFDLTRDLTAEHGDGVFPAGFETSGLRGAVIPTAEGIAGGTAPWTLKFAKASPDKGFKYLCALHGRFMSGSVEVNP